MKCDFLFFKIAVELDIFFENTAKEGSFDFGRGQLMPYVFTL